MSLKKILCVSVATLIITGTLFMVFMPQTQAQIFGFNPLRIPFGGRVLRRRTLCTCSFAFKTTVGLPRPGIFMRTLFTKVYEYDDPARPNLVLGIASLYYPCLQFVSPLPPFCHDFGGGPAIIMMGTSGGPKK